MIEVGIFTTGGTDLPFKKTRHGIRVPDATIEEINAASQRVTNDQIRQGVLADRVGFDYYWMSEHHFIFEGGELSPNPIQSETAIAALTKRIRIGQAANILPWHHPLRLAEQLAILDVISGGRIEVGLGRGYQQRETEIFGYSYGSASEEERNRAYFDEAYELMVKAWTEPSFSFHGDFFQVPAKYVKWGHPSTAAYWEEFGNGHGVDDVMGTLSGADVRIAPITMDPDSYLRELSLLPRTIQKPHPPLWQLVVSPRSLRNAARHGFNGYFNLVSNQVLKQQIDSYMQMSEEYGWPDPFGQGPFKPGWDATKHRGIITGRWIHAVEPGLGNADRFREGLENVWEWYHPFGFSALVTGDPTVPATPQLLEDADLAFVGSKDEIIEKILRIRDEVYSESDFFFNAQFEASGLRSPEIEEQIQFFAEEIIPVLRRECGGGPDLPESSVELVPGVPTAT